MELLRCRSLVVLVLLAEIGWLQQWSVEAAPQHDIKFRIECKPENDISLAVPPPSLLSSKHDPIVRQDNSKTFDGQDQDIEQSEPQPQVKAPPDTKLSSHDKVAESPENVENVKLLKIPKLKSPLKEAIMDKIKSTELQSIKKPDLLGLKNKQADPTEKSGNTNIASPNEAVDLEEETVKQPKPSDNKLSKLKLPKLSSILKSKESEASADDTPKPKESLLSKIANLKKSKEPEIVEQPDTITEHTPVQSLLSKIAKLKKSKEPEIVEQPDSIPEQTPVQSLLSKIAKLKKSKDPEIVEQPDSITEQTPVQSLLSKIAKLKKSKEPEIVEQPDLITEHTPVQSQDSKLPRLKLKSKLLKSPKTGDSPKEQFAEESAPAPKYFKLDKLQLKKPVAPEQIASSGDDYTITPKEKPPQLKSSLLKSPEVADSEPESPLKPLNLDKLSSALERLKSTASNILEDSGNTEKLAPPKLSRLSKPFDFESLRPKKLNLDNNFLQSERDSPKMPKLLSRLQDPPIRRPLLKKPYGDRYLAAEQTDYSPMAMSLCECIKKAFPKGVQDGSFVLSDDGDLASSADSMHPVFAAAPAKMLRDARLADEESSAEKYSKIKNGVQK